MIIDTLQVHVTNQEPDKYWQFVKDIILPISFLIFGALLGYGIDWLKANKVFRKTRKYLFYSLFTLKEHLKFQIKEYENYIKALNEPVNNIPTFTLVSGFSLRAINVVSYNDLFKIFYKGGSKKNRNFVFDLSTLVNGFEIIQSVVDNLDSETRDIHIANENRLTRFNELFNKLRDLIYELMIVDREKASQIMNNFIDELSEAGNNFQTWKDTNNKNDLNINIFEQVEHNIKPIKDVVVKYNYVLMLGFILDIEQTLFEIETNRENFAEKCTREMNNLILIRDHIVKLLRFNKNYLDKNIRENDKDIKELNND